tara:strand:+ start:382 stop:1005 length:624 start_codon:yes stop_codon:yes gene_type:complete
MKKNPIEEINNFLKVSTPKSWANEAKSRIPELLNDHANCELKAASTAMGFIYKYSSFDDLCYKMSRIAREELRHFEQVKSLMKKRDIAFEYVKPSRYAKTLREAIRKNEPERFMDSLIVGAIIEARSCERFYYLISVLPSDISDFYERLVESESRHFLMYLGFARDHSRMYFLDFENKLDELLCVESEIITRSDNNFGFHSGPSQLD